MNERPPMKPVIERLLLPWRWLAGLLGRRSHSAVEISRTRWAALCRAQPELARLSAPEAERLRGLAGRFLAGRPFYAAGGMELSDAAQLRIAALAALPVLELGLVWLKGIRSVVVYPDAFEVDHEEMDEAGVVHEVRGLRAGEAWSHGTLVLSWRDVEAGLRPGAASSVVIHEVAHFIDGANGAVNGFPPLPRGQSRQRWTADFQAAYDRLNRQITAGATPSIDPYAATDPAEFFAVLSEYFFRHPEPLLWFDSRLYRHFSLFYGQDPLRRGDESVG